MKTANLNLRIQLSGSGRPLVIQRQPISNFQFSTTSPPSALSVNSPVTCSKLQLQPGNNLITIVPSYITGAVVYYCIIAPPSTSTNVKLLRGSTSDYGVSLNPAMPLILAFGNSPTNFYIASAAAELVDMVII